MGIETGHRKGDDERDFFCIDDEGFADALAVVVEVVLATVVVEEVVVADVGGGG
jgi:hypothetical protein